MSLMLLDSASLYYRAFHALPDSLKAPDGTVVNALRGMLDFTARLLQDHSPDALVACWDDDWRPQWRVDLLASYKAHRLADGTEHEDTPDALAPQVPLIREAFDLLGIAVVGAPGAEADDIIAALTARSRRSVDIVTGDRDLFQLVDDARSIRVLYTSRGVSSLDRVDATWIHDKYGIEPHQYADFATMRGDSSDGIPGVAGIGEKTAATLLREHGDLESILTAAGDEDSGLTTRVRASLRQDPDAVRRMRRVVGVRTDVTDASAEPVPRPDAERIAAFAGFAERWGLGGSGDRLLRALTQEE